jgi:hypothetical protein
MPYDRRRQLRPGVGGVNASARCCLPGGGSRFRSPSVGERPSVRSWQCAPRYRPVLLHERCSPGTCQSCRGPAASFVHLTLGSGVWVHCRALWTSRDNAHRPRRCTAACAHMSSCAASLATRGRSIVTVRWRLAGLVADNPFLGQGRPPRSTEAVSAAPAQHTYSHAGW